MAEVGKTDFEFYAKFAKPLILTLNCTEDRILAAAWFSKLRDEASGSDQLRLDYLKLLLFVLQRHRLAGPFTENPNAQEQLEEFGEEYELAAVARQIIEKEQKERKEHYLKKIRGEVGDWPPFSTDYSPDLKEYVAAQDIPNFGVHVYYAISKDPILDWDRSEHAVFPRAVRRMEPQGRISETSFAIIEPRPETPEESEKCKILEETGVMPDESIFLGRRAKERRSPYKDIDRPAPPLGILPGEGEEERLDEELPPPTWGSNLIEVREPLDQEGPETPPREALSAADVAEGVSEKSIPQELDAEDPEIVKLLETSFNMEDILAEVDAMEVEEPRVQPDEVDPLILEEQQKFRDIEADLDRHDAVIAEALAALDDDEKRMLMEMEAEEAAGLEPKPKPSPKKEVKVVADEDTVIKVLVEKPEAVAETKEEKKRKEAKAAAEKKRKPPGRTGLNKGKAKGAILKPGEKKEVEEQEKKAKVVETKTGIPSKRPGVPKPKASKVKIAAAASEGEIPSEKPSVTGKGKGIPGKGIPRKGIPRKAAKPPGGTAEMQEMKERLEHKIEETKEAYPDKFAAEQMGAGPSGAAQAQLEEEEGARGRTPVDEVATFVSPGSPESDDIYDEMDREYQILERLYELYQQLAPDRPEGLRTPPVFSKHPEIRELGRQLRYRADEFDLHPGEKFQPAAEYFAGEGAAAPSPFVDPRDVGRLAHGAQPPEEPEMPPSRIAVESPPWTKIEELKRITEMAEKGLDASPAISGGVGMTTPKSPSTPRRPVRRDLRLEFDMESPPQYESPPGSPQGMPTPEFLMDPSHGLPQVVTGQMLEDMYAGKQAEYDAYIQAEMEAEKSLWPVLAPRAPTPPPPPPRVSPRSPGAAVTPPQQRPSPRAPTPPSVGGPGVPARAPGTPRGLPPSMRFQYTTPPKFRTTEKVEIPGEPEFEEFDPFQHEDIMYQTMPELVEADLDDFDTSMTSPQFELKDWYDPMKAILEAEEEPEMIFDVSDEMGEIDLVPAEEDYRAYSPAITLQERLMGHEIPKEFFDPSRPGAKSKQVTIGSRKVQVPRTSKPTTLAKETIREDLSGERFEESLEEYEDMINAEEEEFLNISLGDPDRTEYLKKMADEAQDIEALEEEAPPDLFDMDMSFGSPERPPRPPSPPVETPPFGPGREILLYGGTPEEYDENIFLDEEPEFLASPGMPSPPPPPTPPPPGPPSPETPPWAPPFETFYSEDIFQDEEPDFLASPGMPPGRTLEDDMREIGGPIQLPPSSWELPSPPPPVPVNVPLGPLGRPLGPGDVQVSPQRSTGRGIPSPRMRQVAPVGTPEFDPAGFRRELMGHRVEFAGKERFQAGERMVPRRTPIPRQYFPIREHAGYEESMKLHREVDDYREMMSRLPPLPPPAPYPEELMGQERQGRFAYQETLLDQPLSPMESLPSPLAPKRGLTGWQTPPHLRVERPPPIDVRTPSPTRLEEALMRMPPHISMISRGQLPFEEEGFMDLREEDVFPSELQDSYGSPRVPASMMVSPPPSMAIPTMTMDQQMNQAEQRALWQAQQIAERTPPRPSPPPRPPQRQPQPPPSPAPPPPEQRSPPRLPPCARPPESEPKVLKRVQETTYSSEVYDPDSPENSRRWTKGRTMLEFNRPEEGDRGRPVASRSPQGAAAHPRGSPVSTTPPRQMPQPRPAMARVPRPAQQGGMPRMQGRRLPMRHIIEGQGAVLPKRKLFQDAGQQAPPSGPPPRRVCPGAPKGEKVEIVEEFEETEHDYIPEHLRGYKWMDDPEADQFYETFKQQFR